MTRRPIKRYNIETGEVTYVDASGSVGPDYVYGAEALAAMREELGLTPEPKRKKDGLVYEVHRCQPPGVKKQHVGSIWYCDTCGKFAELYRYKKPGRYWHGYGYYWEHVGWLKQRRLEKQYLR